MLHIAVQDAAEVVDGGGVQGLVFTEFVDGGAGEVVVLDHGVPPEPFSFMVCGGLFLDYSR